MINGKSLLSTSLAIFVSSLRSLIACTTIPAEAETSPRNIFAPTSPTNA